MQRALFPFVQVVKEDVKAVVNLVFLKAGLISKDWAPKDTEYLGLSHVLHQIPFTMQQRVHIFLKHLAAVI